MTPTGAPPPAAPGKAPKILAAPRRLFWRVYRLARLDLWFPHVPLALAVGFAGMQALLPSIRRYVREYLHLQLNGLFDALHPLDPNVPALILRGVPTTVVGALQIFVAIGLLLRSRLAWIGALVITLAQGAVAVLYNHQPWDSWAVLYIAALFFILSVSGRDFRRSSLAAGTLFALAATLLVLSYGVLGALILGEGFTPPILSLPQAAYFTIVTMSTVGYGDILPKSEDARLFVMSLIVIGITVFATSITAVVGPVVQGRLHRIIEPEGRRRMKRVNHFIIIGTGALAYNTARELLARGESVVVISDKEIEFGDAEVMLGDPTELETLRKAGAEAARAILALSPDDSENAFVILAARELNVDARKVAAVSSRKNLERMRRVQPDMVFAPNVFGGEILAMALTQEKIDGDALVARMLDAGAKPAG
ncbi:voltage-gated potassium channel protein [Acidocella sp.]|uniref:voltage-gated potassium channel protein n=1 Tax=Acidocella sp. TaxID=50710 RepID=UPI002627634F|nr:voltage-gated potassium channel protein [Acidocella sp.]